MGLREKWLDYLHVSYHMNGLGDSYEHNFNPFFFLPFLCIMTIPSLLRMLDHICELFQTLTDNFNIFSLQGWFFFFFFHIGLELLICIYNCRSEMDLLLFKFLRIIIVK